MTEFQNLIDDHNLYHQQDPEAENFNWINNLNSNEKTDIERHREIIGSPLIFERNNPQHRSKAFNIATRVNNHWQICKQKVQERFSGKPFIKAFHSMYQGAIFRQHTYVEGTSGSGKSAAMRYLSQLIPAPFSFMDASSDVDDLNFLGGEIPIGGHGGISFKFQRGSIITPGALGLMIDELPRLPSNAVNAMLQALAERRVYINLIATEGRTFPVKLSPHFFVLATGNPVGYGGQGERNRALFDRFGIGINMPQPSSEERLKMLRDAVENNKEEQRPESVPLDFSLYEARAAASLVNISDNLIKRIVAMSYAISPEAYRKNVAWNKCPFLEDLKDSRQVANKDLRDLTTLVEESLQEGSNPRGEVYIVQNAQALAIMNATNRDNIDNALKASKTNVIQGFLQANLHRIKTYPGAESAVPAVLNKAIETFFPELTPNQKKQIGLELTSKEKSSLPQEGDN